jgi:hypothetical protein
MRESAMTPERLLWLQATAEESKRAEKKDNKDR